MKRIFCIMLCICACLNLCACNTFKKEPARLSVLLRESDDVFIDMSQLESGAGEKYIIDTQKVSAALQKEKAEEAIKNGSFAIILDNFDESGTNSVIAIAKSSGTPVILIGNAPKPAIMDSYDKLWYLGANATQGGELLGSKIGNMYKSGAISDNGDGILEYSMLDAGKTDVISSTIASCADLGVFSQEIASYNECYSADTAYNSAIETINGENAGELILCYGTQIAKAALRAKEETKSAVPIACIGDGTLADNEDLKSNLLAYTAYPAQDIATAALAYLNNIMLGEAVTNGTPYAIDEHKALLFPYISSN
ncbi:MAG: substrate-binding domain-containing protein [Oscillospiraceae bacterium]